MTYCGIARAGAASWRPHVSGGGGGGSDVGVEVEVGVIDIAEKTRESQYS